MHTRAVTIRRVAALSLFGVGFATLAACGTRGRDERLVDLVARGEFTEARYAASSTPREDATRSDAIDRMRVLITALGEGLPQAARNDADAMYKLLRTAGVNQGSDVGTFVLNEEASRTFKGDPFEQAMAFHYIALLDGLGDGATPGDWGNLRAGENNALFSVKDFSKVRGRNAARIELEMKRQRERFEADQRAGRVDAAEQFDERTVRAQAERDAILTEQSGGTAGKPAPLEPDAAPVASDFEIGYVMRAIAARQLGELDETRTSAAQIVQINPALNDYAQLLIAGNFNTVLVVDYGLGPAKYATGPDNVVAARRAITRSDSRTLVVRVGQETGRFPVITDLNRLAVDARWANLEDLRRAKSAIGSALIIAGATTATVSKDRTAQYAGLGAIVLGALMKAGSAADIRHIDVMPQRVYVALLNIPPAGATIDLQIDGLPESRLILPSVPGPVSSTARLLYTRLPVRGSSSAWTTAGRVLYDNDVTAVSSRSLPYIVGGNCVRTPSQAALDAYHAAGNLTEINSVGELQQLYRDEGIKLVEENRSQPVGTHILAGGTWLYTPLPASAGYVSLMCAPHAAYVPKSARARELAAKYAGTQRAGASTNNPSTNQSPSTHTPTQTSTPIQTPTNPAPVAQPTTNQEKP